MEPNDAVVYKKRGYWYAINQDLDKSLEDFDHSIKLDDSDAQVYNYRSAVKILLNKEYSAFIDLCKAIAIDEKILSVLTPEQYTVLNRYTDGNRHAYAC